MKVSSRNLRLLLGLIALIFLIFRVWETQHRHSVQLPPQLQAGRHGNQPVPALHPR